mmetsp:Transcript_74091/g.149909  ORF Transcript_74091/g.149909 Transcript_74091/m.149909 type:complete len:212 (-) Transcript_74091:672-1307(-)
MVVTRTRHSGAQHISVDVHRADSGGKEGHEQKVVLRLVSRLEQRADLVGAHAPVVMLAGAVEVGERLLVEQHRQIMGFAHLRQDVHLQQVVVRGHVGGCEHRRHFVLAGGDFAVAGGLGDAHLPHGHLRVVHGAQEAVAEGAEVLVVQRLALGWHRTQQRPAGLHDVRAPQVVVALQEEELLLHAAVRVHAGVLRLADGMQQSHCLTVQSL